MRFMAGWWGVLLATAGACAGVEPTVDEKAGTVTVEVMVAKQGKYEVLKGAIEYVLVGNGGKSYEALFVTECAAESLLGALGKIGLEGGEAGEKEEGPRGPAVKLVVEYEKDGKQVRRLMEEFIVNMHSGKTMEPGPWVFTGSRRVFNPETKQEGLEAGITGSLVGLHWTDGSALIQNGRAEAKDENLYRANTQELPKAGTPMKLVIARVQPAEGKVEKGRRAHVFVSGRVQGVGFRAFVQREALKLGVKGWVRNLGDGRVEAVMEGTAEQVEGLLERVREGPRGARVQKVAVTEEAATGEFKTFEAKE